MAQSPKSTPAPSSNSETPSEGSSATSHEGLPVAGYTPQSQERIDLVNRGKAIEEVLMRHLDDLKGLPNMDPRMVALAVTHLQTASMWAARAVFQPGRLTDADLAAHNHLVEELINR